MQGYNLSLPDVYKYVHRNGCIDCPMSCNRVKELLIIFPKYYNFWFYGTNHLFNNSEKIRKQFSSANDLMQWWLSDLSIVNYHELKKQDIIFY